MYSSTSHRTHTFLSSTLGLVVAALVGAMAPAVATAQTRAALVRSVDEPARVPYFHSAAPSCPFLNSCSTPGPTVPAGKRLRVTKVQGVLPFQANSVFVVLYKNNNSTPMVMFQADFFNAAYYGNTASFAKDVEIYFEAGETPILEVGNSTSISDSGFNRLTIVGYIVDVLP